MNKIISVLGMPGSGKSTLIRHLKNYYGDNMLIASIPAMVKNKDDFYALLSQEEILSIHNLKEMTKISREKGDLVSIELDELLFNVCLRNAFEKEIIVFDGCPRGFKQAELLWSKMTEGQRKGYYIIHLKFPMHQDSYSFYRQYTRTVQEKGIHEAYNRVDRFKNKIAVYNEDTMKGILDLKKKTTAYFSLDCTIIQEKIKHETIKIINDSVICEGF